MAPLGLAGGALGISHLLQMAQDPPQAGWVQAAGRLDQDRLGLGGHLGGQVVGAMGDNGGVGDRQLPGAQRLGRLGQGAAEQGPGGPHRRAGGAGAQVEPVAQPTRGRGSLDPVLGPSRSAGVHGRQLPEPVAFQAVQQPPQDQHPLGPDRIGQPGQVPGGEVVDRRLKGRQPVRVFGRTPVRMWVRVHGGNLSTPHQKASTSTNLWTSF
jgi:hypothetical protein